MVTTNPAKTLLQRGSLHKKTDICRSVKWDLLPVTFLGNRTRNKSGTECPKTRHNKVKQGAGKSMRSTDGRLFFSAHNPTVDGSSPLQKLVLWLRLSLPSQNDTIITSS